MLGVVVIVRAKMIYVAELMRHSNILSRRHMVVVETEDAGCTRRLSCNSAACSAKSIACCAETLGASTANLTMTVLSWVSFSVRCGDTWSSVHGLVSSTYKIWILLVKSQCMLVITSRNRDISFPHQITLPIIVRVVIVPLKANIACHLASNLHHSAFTFNVSWDAPTILNSLEMSLVRMLGLSFT